MGMEFADVGAGVVGVGATGDVVGDPGAIGEDCEENV